MTSNSIRSAAVTVLRNGHVDITPAGGVTVETLAADAVAALDGRSPGRIVRDRFGTRIRVTPAVARDLGVLPASSTPAAVSTGTPAEVPEPAPKPTRSRRRTAPAPPESTTTPDPEPTAATTTED